MELLIAIYLLITTTKYLLAHFSIKKELNSINAEDKKSADLPALIIQPVLGGDPRLSEMLELNLIEHRSSNFYWVVTHEDMIGKEVCEKLINAYPNHSIKLVLTEEAPRNTNPKTHKISYVLPFIRCDLESKLGFFDFKSPIIVLDDDTYLPKATKARLLSQLSNNALTTALPCYKYSEGYWSKIHTQFCNNNSAMTYLPITALLKPVSINGMCFAMTYETYEYLDFLNPIHRCLADDLAISSVFRKKKLMMYQSSLPVFLKTTIKDSKHYASIMHRWFLFSTLLMSERNILTKSLVVLFNVVPTFILLALLLGSLTHLFALLALLYIREIVICSIHNKIDSNHNIYFDRLPSIISEILQPLHLLSALTNRTINWRGKIYDVTSNFEFTKK